MGKDFNYAREFKTLGPGGGEERSRAVMTDSQDLVAGRLRPLRTFVHPHGLAQRGHVSDR